MPLKNTQELKTTKDETNTHNTNDRQSVQQDRQTYGRTVLQPTKTKSFKVRNTNHYANVCLVTVRALFIFVKNVKNEKYKNKYKCV